MNRNKLLFWYSPITISFATLYHFTLFLFLHAILYLIFYIVQISAMQSVTQPLLQFCSSSDGKLYKSGAHDVIPGAGRLSYAEHLCAHSRADAAAHYTGEYHPRISPNKVEKYIGQDKIANVYAV